MSKWYARYLNLAHEVASWSKDRSTQVGAVIIAEDGTPGPYGYNGFPRAVNDEVESRHERPHKYHWTEHAERNAIYNAARVGVSLKGGTIYVTHFPCIDCVRGIIQSGLKKVVVDSASLDGDFSNRWEGDRHVSKEMLEEAGVEIVIVDLGNS